MSAREPIPMAMFVGSWLPPSETFVFDHLQRQAHFRAHVFATGRTGGAPQFPYEPLVVLGLRDALRFRYLGRSRFLSRALSQVNAKLAFAHFGLNGAFALPFVRRLGLPLAVMFHGHDVGGLLPTNRFTLRYARYQALARELFDYASVLLCASEELKQTLLTLGAPEPKLCVHRLGIDLERFRPAQAHEKSPNPLVLMVGRLVEKKGMTYGLEAFAALKRTLPDAELRIIGTGPLENALKRQVARLGLQSSVHFLGACTHDDVSRNMRQAHVLLTPSVTTPSGDRESGVIVIKEAAATGLPCVATRHGGIPEIIEHERTGFLVDERTVTPLTQALAALFSDPERLRNMGLHAREKMVRQYDQRKQAATLESRLLELIRA